MDVFTEVYNKSVELLKAPGLHADWKDVEGKLKALLEPDGPSIDNATALDKLRAQLAAASKKSKTTTAKAQAEEIVRAARVESDGYQDRAALLKQLQHLYLIAKKGGQSIWVVDCPSKYGKWTYDLFSGKSAEDLKVELAKTEEIFGAGNRKMMSDALQLARKWSADAEVKLGGKSEKTLAIVQRWFHQEGAKAEDVAATQATLLDGFKKITSACNSGRIMFSDRPHKRASGEMKNTIASVNGGDAMPVIYLYEVFLQTGKRNLVGKVPKLWYCALTIVHELTHKLLKTQDLKYDYDGLKPRDTFPAAQAILNADSWAYFAGDVLGLVPKAALKEALG